MKKGLSPIIGWVLLVGFSVAAGILVTTWTINIAKDTDLPENRESYCNEVEIGIGGICIKEESDEKHKVQFDLTNEGSFTIRRLSFGRETSLYGLDWCQELLTGTDAITPENTETKEFVVTSESSQYENLNVVKCSDLSNGAEVIQYPDHVLTKIEIIPWITIYKDTEDEETFPCNDKGIILNNADTDLNTAC